MVVSRKNVLELKGIGQTGVVKVKSSNEHSEVGAGTMMRNSLGIAFAIYHTVKQLFMHDGQASNKNTPGESREPVALDHY